jgi:hypothetical protein
MVVARGEERAESTDTERSNRVESGNKKERPPLPAARYQS